MTSKRTATVPARNGEAARGTTLYSQISDARDISSQPEVRSKLEGILRGLDEASTGTGANWEKHIITESKETVGRSLGKTLTYRTIGSLISGTGAYWVTHRSTTAALAVFGMDFIVKGITYFAVERVFAKINLGYRNGLKSAAKGVQSDTTVLPG